MALLKGANNASTTLANAISNTATSVTLAAGTGSKFPAITGSQYFRATFVKNGDSAIFEIVKVTAVSGDTFTIQRNLPAPDATTPLAWAVGDSFNYLWTAGDLADLVQFDDLQASNGNYAADAGSANAYSVTLSPALAAHVVGMPIRFKAANSNTGASTFNDGAGALSLVMPEGSVGGALVPGDIAAGGIYVAAYDGTRFQLIGSHRQGFSQLTGQVSNSQVPQSSVTQHEEALSIGGGQVNSPVASAANASMLGGNSPSTAPMANTIAQRDSSGNLAAANFNSGSDARLKKDIEPITDALEALSRLRGVRFTWRRNGQRSAGIIAQEGLKATPELVSEDENGFLAVNYDGYIGYLIEALRQCDLRIAALESRVNGMPR